MLKLADYTCSDVVLDCEEVRVLVGEFEKDRNEWIRALSQKTE